MRRDTSNTREPKGRYRVRNWAAYNAGLINRGNVTMWIDDAALANLPDTESARGRPRLYNDALIQALLSLKTVFHLPLRALQGFAQSLRELAFAQLPVPNYTTLCRRAQTLKVQLPIIRDGASIHLVVDSTGVKVYGEGEWKVRQHGYSKRRTWRKVHLALDANSGQVCAALMTHQDVADGDVLADLLDQIPTDERLNVVGGDGAYDSKACHAAIVARGAVPSIPPREGAAHWPANTPGAAWRNSAVDAIARVGRREWKKNDGYHRRSLAENVMYRFKTLTGNSLWARLTDAQAAEIAIRVGVLNRMADLARPQSVRIA
ncbi:IS5 family transposase [Burkholderia multivorans]|uniref:IS5 family transposase n=1 Tax=Burkholderia multivorans TaxID=87883 RepID=UPI0020186614|nr:IS5 family transposase [Burkholderia multivorans]UQN69453.1 IS5 family transposase [Burkholderia multivorans]UQN70132.1 IS5 family transposase [Burkholderia multivorans]UQN75181.1 IS5 family transposase [Burkholderia multivorans]UQN75860.1 IS5 family transposase [Burkholderia multivorans]